MTDDENTEVPMAECGACRAVIPADSTQCPECGVKFSGSSDQELGECGACGSLVPVDSRSCPSCGVVFVADDVLDVLRKWVATTGIGVKTLFSKFDVNGDGEISSSELKEGLLGLNLADLPPSQVDKLVEAIDEDGNGTIDLAELEATISGEVDVAADDSDSSPVEEEEESIEDTESDDANEALEEVEEESEEEDDDEEIEEIEDEDSESESEGEVGRELIDSNLSTSIVAYMQDNNTDMAELFNVLDSDGSGSISYMEILTKLQDILGANISNDAFVELFENSDEDKDGEISLDEFVALVDDEQSREEDSDAEEIDDYQEGDVISKNLIKHLVVYFDENEIDVSRAFTELDADGNGTLTMQEIQDAVSGMLGKEVSEEAFAEIFDQLDEDGDGNVDLIEFISLVEEVEDDLDEEPEEEENFNKFPSPLQMMMMKKSFHDNAYVIIYGFFGLIIALILVNALVGPVDGSGGLVEFSTENPTGRDFTSSGDVVYEGDVYECEKDIQEGKCSNSLTPLAGEDGASSMPKGWYWDATLGMVLSLIGITVGAIFQFMLVPGWRARYKAMKEAEKDHEDAQEEMATDSTEEEDEEESEDDELEDEELEHEGDDDYEDSEEEDEDFDDDDDEDFDDDDDYDDDDEEGIDIGTRVGVESEDGDWFGVVVEFDEDDDSLVIVKSEEDDEEYEVEWDSLFMPDDD
ncbi:MAG: EF-hand domain-containing protein [Candidatus Poseidoniaceae archaeon]